MHDLLFHSQKALEDDDLRRYADQLSLDLEVFDRDRRGEAVLECTGRDVESGIASGEVGGTPTLFIDGERYRGADDADSRLDALHREALFRALIGRSPAELPWTARLSAPQGSR